jgi:sulfate permease, SulP family
MLVGFAEGLGAAKTYAARAGYEIDPNRELLGLGAANVAAGLSSGLFIGIASSMLLLVYRTSRPRIAKLGKVARAAGHYSDMARHREDVSPDGVAVLRVESGLFFANADWVHAQVLHAATRDGIHAVVLDAENIPFIDVTAVEMLDQLDRDLQRAHVRLARRPGRRPGPRCPAPRERGPDADARLPGGPSRRRRRTAELELMPHPRG